MNAVLLAALLSCTAEGAGIESLGRELAAGARSAGVRRVAVAELEPGGGLQDGSFEERLTNALVRSGKVEVLERSQLEKLLQARAQPRSGAREGRSQDPLAAADAVLIGRYAPAGRGVRLSARIVKSDTGVIVAAADARLEEEGSLVPSSLSGGCGLEAGLPSEALDDALDLMARQRVLAERAGLAGGHDPGAFLQDSVLRGWLLALLDHHRAAPEVRALSGRERGRLEAAESALRCAGRGGGR